MTKRANKDARQAAAVTLGREFRKARERIGISQDEAAYRLRVLLPEGRRPTGSGISRIEAGLIERPEPYVLWAMSIVYGVPLEEIDLRAAKEAVAIKAVLDRCAPWESNPEPADFPKSLALAA